MKCKIAFCGPDEAGRAIFSDRLIAYDRNCQLFSSPEELTGALRYYLPDILFVRAEFGENRLAPCVAALRRSSPDCALLLVSSGSGGAELSFLLRADDYLPAPVSQESLDSAIARVFVKRPWAFQTLSLGEKKPQIKLRDVLYIESRDHYCLVHMADGELTQLREKIGKLACDTEACGFFRIHRSFLLNLRRVRSLEGGSFVLENGTYLPISAASRSAAAEAYSRLLMERHLQKSGRLF